MPNLAKSVEFSAEPDTSTNVLSFLLAVYSLLKRSKTRKQSGAVYTSTPADVPDPPFRFFEGLVPRLCPNSVLFIPGGVCSGERGVRGFMTVSVNASQWCWNTNTRLQSQSRHEASKKIWGGGLKPLVPPPPGGGAKWVELLLTRGMGKPTTLQGPTLLQGGRK